MEEQKGWISILLTGEKQWSGRLPSSSIIGENGHGFSDFLAPHHFKRSKFDFSVQFCRAGRRAGLAVRAQNNVLLTLDEKRGDEERVSLMELDCPTKNFRTPAMMVPENLPCQGEHSLSLACTSLNEMPHLSQGSPRGRCVGVTAASFLPRTLLVAVIAVFIVSNVVAATNEMNWLSQDSVVLLAGATTSLLGSEVALALYRLFDCHVVLIDDLNNNGQSRGLVEGLSTLEFQRQSLFRVWQEIDDHLTVYRMSARTIIPDIDPGTTVDRLAHVFEKHQPTHVLIFPETPETYRGDTDDDPPRAGVLEGLLEQVLSFHNNHPEKNRPHVVWTSTEDVYPETGVWSETDSPPMPETKEGTNAMVNEIIAQAYDDKGVSSVVLRLAKHIYGPFHDKYSPLFSIIENLLKEKESNSDSIPHAGDYLYVDDAVDAVMASMQLPTVPHTYAINVASGSSVMNTEEILARVHDAASALQVKAAENEGRRLKISLAEQALNFSPRVSLTNGLLRTIAWHYDRYGGQINDSALPGIRDMARENGVASCSDSSDTECLRGTPILPCSSECAHQQQCRPTAWDGMLPKIETWTASCHAVLYTIRQTFESNVFAISPQSKSRWPDAHCNLAFIPGATSDEFEIQDGWTIVSVPIQLSDVDSWLVPLWSPGKVFPRSKWAVYKSPNVAWNDLDQLMEAVNMQPEGEDGATALLIGMDNRQDRPRNAAQREAYRAIHIKATQIVGTDEFHDPFFSDVDAGSWMVHRLGHPDSEQLRCDITKEIGSWKGVVDFDAAAAFVFGLHDLWSQVLLHEKGQTPWWHGSSVITVPRKKEARRRLQEEPEPHHDSPGEKQAESNAAEIGREIVEEDEEDEFEDVHHFDHNGFGVSRQSVGAAVNTDEAKTDEKEEDDEEEPQEDDDTAPDAGLVPKEDKLDPSKYDTWLGVLTSSTDTHMFVRIVDPKLVGTVFLDEYESTSKTI